MIGQGASDAGLLDVPIYMSGKRKKLQKTEPSASLVIEAEDGSVLKSTFLRSMAILLGRDREIQRTYRALKTIPYGHRAGALTIAEEPQGECVEAVCDCGFVGLYPAADLASLIELGLGCCRRECSVIGSLKYDFWVDRPRSLRLQLYGAIRARSDLVCPEWGGTLGEGTPARLEDAAAALEEELSEHPVAANQVWLKRTYSPSGFIPGNVRWSRQPDPLFRVYGEQSLDVGGQRRTVKELCTLAKCSWPELLVLLFDVDDSEGEDLLFKFMNKVYGGSQ